MSSSRQRLGESGKHGTTFFVVSYTHKGNVEFIVIRKSWMVEEGFLSGDSDSDSGCKTQYFLWPKNWSNLTTRELKELYDKKKPEPDWKKYAILRIHKTKGTLLEAKNARNRAEDDYINKNKRLSEIGDTSDDSSRTIESRKSRSRKLIDDDFVSGAKRAKSTTAVPLSSKIQASKETAPVYKKSALNLDNNSRRHPSPGPSTSTEANQVPIRSSSCINTESNRIFALPPTPPSRILPVTPPSRFLSATPPSEHSSQNKRTPRSIDSFLKSLSNEQFREGQPVDGVQFKFYMTGMFLGIKSLQNDVALIRAGASGTPFQPPPPMLGPKPMDVEWPLNTVTFIEQEDYLKDDYLLEEMTLWLSNSNNTLYSTKFGEMAKNILQRMFPVELQASFVFSKGSYSKTEVRFESTMSYKMVRGALEKAHGSGKEKLGEYREAVQVWWDHKSDNFKEFLQRKHNAQILARFGDENMLMRDRIKLFKEHYAAINDMDPKMFICERGEK